ncbi:hypothetical protein Dimus_016837 [Dionaea muscipula]
MEVMEVFSSNLYNSTVLFNEILKLYNVITIDTEFPGCLRSTPPHASSDHRYDDLRYNVHRTKLIQIGVTLSNDAGNIGGTWQFNLSDFNPEIDHCAPDSIALLTSTGVDFRKNSAEGIPGLTFAAWMTSIIVHHGQKLRWVTFHGLYDFGYLVLMLTGRSPLPVTAGGFIEAVKRLFGARVYDLKVVAEGCGFFDGKGFGLGRLAEFLGVERSAGVAHQAGSDSLLTAKVFGKLREIMGLKVETFAGRLYGIDLRTNGPAAIDEPPPRDVYHLPVTRVLVNPPLVYCPRPSMVVGLFGYAGIRRHRCYC